MTTNPIDTIKTDHLTQDQAIELIERLSYEHGIPTNIINNGQIATRLAVIIGNSHSKFPLADGIPTETFTPAALQYLKENHIDCINVDDDRIMEAIDDSLDYELEYSFTSLGYAISGKRERDGQRVTVAITRNPQVVEKLPVAMKNGFTAKDVEELQTLNAFEYVEGVPEDYIGEVFTEVSFVIDTLPETNP